MDVSGSQWMPDRAHHEKRKAILWHHASSIQRIERVELVNHESQSESPASSLKMIVDNVEAIARDTVSKTEPAKGSKASLRHLLSRLSIAEVKAVHCIVQAGRTPSWLRDSSSIESLYHNLNEIGRSTWTFSRPESTCCQPTLQAILKSVENGTLTHLMSWALSCKKRTHIRTPQADS